MVRAQRLPDVTPPPIVDDAASVEAYLEDASGLGAGRAAGLVRVGDEAEAAAFLRATHGKGVPILPQAARSSVTGGAMPAGEVVLSVERMTGAVSVERGVAGARCRVQAGTRLCDLQRQLSEVGLFFPPVPTYQQAMIGGSVSTNAGGAASFKYGVTRDWVHGLRVLLHDGDLLAIERGQAVAARGDAFRILSSGGEARRIETPSYRLPDLKKISAGYHSADPLDLVDLFVGAEGTLGLITEVTLDLAPAPPAVVAGMVVLDDAPRAFALAAALRERAEEGRRRRDPRSPDVRSIEWIDEHGVALLRSHGDARRCRVRLDHDARAVVLFELELSEPASDDRLQASLAGLFDDGGDVPDTPLGRLGRVLVEHGALDGTELAFPGDGARRRAFAELRESLPLRINEILGERRRIEPVVSKVGGDLIVPFERLREMTEVYRQGFERRGLEYAIWGHLSDGNLHPNAIVRNADELAAGHEALYEFAREAARRGGCPLSEHGVGRHPVKQEILRRFLGDAAVGQMRRIKRALDPEGRFAPGVLFAAP